MVSLPWRDGPPKDVVRRLGRGVKVLTWAEADDGTWVLGTRSALHLIGDDVVEIPWQHVQKADWDHDADTLTVERVTDFGTPVERLTLTVPAPGGLPMLLRERVTASIVLQRRVEVAPRRGFVMIARRPPSGPGDITFAFRLDAGLDPEDPIVAHACEVALAEAKESLGG